MSLLDRSEAVSLKLRQGDYLLLNIKLWLRVKISFLLMISISELEKTPMHILE